PGASPGASDSTQSGTHAAPSGGIRGARAGPGPRHPNQSLTSRVSLCRSKGSRTLGNPVRRQYRRFIQSFIPRSVMTIQRFSWSSVFAVFLVLLSFAAPVRADDTADEAELHFQLGAERYQAGDFKGALEHFLASNRLVPNRNVLFNIARTYEQLKQSPDAYRY